MILNRGAGKVALTRLRRALRRPEEKNAARRNPGLLPSNGIVFNIKGNAYQPVAAVRYDKQIMYIRFVGTRVRPDRRDECLLVEVG